MVEEAIEYAIENWELTLSTLTGAGAAARYAAKHGKRNEYTEEIESYQDQRLASELSDRGLDWTGPGGDSPGSEAQVAGRIGRAFLRPRKSLYEEILREEAIERANNEDLGLSEYVEHHLD